MTSANTAFTSPATGTGTSFVVYGAPATKGSTVSFMGEGGQVVTRGDCSTLAAWTQAVGWAARAAQLPLLPAGSAVSVKVTFQFVKPKTQQKRPHPSVKPDADKLARALLDALTGVCYHDDAQVVDLRVTKVYGSDARATITVTGVA